MRYFDSGVLLKLYLAEPRSPDAVGFVDDSENPPLFTDLHGLEMRSALRQKAGRKEITVDECAVLLGNLEADLNSGVYATPSAVWSDVFAKAEALSAAHGSSTLCRSLDTLHVALALTLGASEFCTFDKRQILMAKAAGLTVMS